MKHLKVLADYNQWVNQLLLEKINQSNSFSEEILVKLNHILLGDKVWLKRFNNSLQLSLIHI